MSFLNALAEQDLRADQGWSFANRYNCSSNNSSGYSKSPGTVDHWPTSAQRQTISTTSDAYAHEIKNSDTDDEITLVDDDSILSADLISNENQRRNSSYHNSYGNSHCTFYQQSMSAHTLSLDQPMTLSSRGCNQLPQLHSMVERYKQQEYPGYSRRNPTPQKKQTPAAPSVMSTSMLQPQNILAHQCKLGPQPNQTHPSSLQHGYHSPGLSPFGDMHRHDLAGSQMHIRAGNSINRGQVVPQLQLHQPSYIHIAPHAQLNHIHHHMMHQHQSPLCIDSCDNKNALMQDSPTGQISSSSTTSMQQNTVTAEGDKVKCVSERYIVQGSPNNQLQKNIVYRLQSPTDPSAHYALYDGQKMVPIQTSKFIISSSMTNNASQTNVTGLQKSAGHLTQLKENSVCHDQQCSVTGLHDLTDLSRIDLSHGGTITHSSGKVDLTPPPAPTQVCKQQHNGQLVEEDLLQSTNSTPVPRFSATNDVWPTPMPSRKNIQVECLKDSASSPSSNSSPLQELPISQLSGDVIELSPESCCKEEVSKILSTSSSSSSSADSPPDESNPGTTSKSESENESTKVKRTFAEDEEGVALCRYCGYSSSDFESCESCKRKLPSDVKVFVKKLKRSSVPESPSESSCSNKVEKNSDVEEVQKTKLNKKTFYGSKSQSLAFSKDKLEELSKGFTKQGKQSVRGRRRNNATRGGGRSKRIRNLMKEPVTLTISSDEDEPQARNCPYVTNTNNNNNNNTGQAGEKATEDGFGVSFQSSPTKLLGFGKSRRERMADEKGMIVTRLEHSIPEDFETVHYMVKARGVRIGSMRTSAASLILQPQAIHFQVTSDRTQDSLEFEVFVKEMTCIQYTLVPVQPVLFISVTPACGLRLRERLRMNNKSPEFFDPGSIDLQRKLIVVIIEDVFNKQQLHRTLNRYKLAHPELGHFLEEMSYEDGNKLLVRSTPPVLNNDKSDQLRSLFQAECQAESSAHRLNLPLLSLVAGGDNAKIVSEEKSFLSANVDGGQCVAKSPLKDKELSRSPSPTIGFVGPIEKLFTYPPPPAKGGITITNEDMFCLNEGEFLNDVIIDFYLKYLYREKLCEADRARTHIFSSFFYKRLTQRHSRSTHDGDDEKLSPAQRRHAKVKTWTRHVDIFSKDFLLVPINEHSHWFLAVICFPGLDSPEYVPFIPIQLSDDGDSSHNEPSSSPSTQIEDTCGVAEDGVQDEPLDLDLPPPSASSSKEILGKIIDSNAVSGVSFSIGQKQPCILILDSLAGPSRSSVIKTLKDYLQVEWDHKRKNLPRILGKKLRGAIPKVPQQTNFSDCGIFVLQYAEAFFENPIANFQIPMKGLWNWFPLQQMEKKREDIRKLLLRLQSECR